MINLVYIKYPLGVPKTRDVKEMFMDMRAI